jgi:hypothetical protein
MITEPDIISDMDILSKRAFFPDLCAALNVTKMPDTRAGANPTPFVGNGRRVNEVILARHLCILAGKYFRLLGGTPSI